MLDAQMSDTTIQTDNEIVNKNDLKYQSILP